MSTTITGAHTTEGLAGPHSSRLANATDPRVDSDLDHSRNAGAATTATTGTTGTTTGHTTNPTTSTGTTTTAPPSKIKESASSAKGILSAIHGAGESIRGNFNSAVDETFNEPLGVEKNNRVAQKGEAEIRKGGF